MPPRKMESITPESTRVRRADADGSAAPPPWTGPDVIGSVSARASRALTERAQLGIWPETLVRIRPEDSEPRGGAGDLLRPDLGGRRRAERAARSAGAGAAQAIERIDAPVMIGPRHAHRVPSDEMDVGGGGGVGLAQEWEQHLLVHVPSRAMSGFPPRSTFTCLPPAGRLRVAIPPGGSARPRSDACPRRSPGGGWPAR